MRSVIAYDNLDSLRNSEYYERIKDVVQFAESSAFAERLREGIFENVHTLNEIIHSIMPEWKGRGHAIQSQAIISKYIHDKLEIADGDTGLWLSGCLKNTFQFWSAITSLEEADVRPQDIDAMKPEIGLMIDIWKKLIEDDGCIQAFRERIGNGSLDDIVRNILDSWMDKGSPDEERICIHGFYFITPLQERIIRSLERCGFNIIFLIPYSQRYPYECEIWKLLYDENKGFDSIDKWIMIDGGYHNPFGDALSGIEVTDEPCRIIEYGGIMDFVNDLRNDGGNSVLYSPNPSSANDLLRNFFPSRYGRRKLSSYPIGGFVSALHKMWDPYEKRIYIDNDLLRDCFTSGWISVNGIRSNTTLTDLEKLLPYFMGCHSIGEWQYRVSLIHNVHADIISIFESKKEGEEGRWDNILDNPFILFSFFDVERSRVDLILRMIKKILDYAVALFGDAPITISDHLGLMVDILKENGTSGEEDDELDLIERLAIETTSLDNGGLFDPSDRAHAIMTFLGNEMGAGSDTDDQMVHPMYDILGDCGHTHICLCGLEDMPGKDGDYVWPLDKDVIQSIHDYQMRSDTVPLIDFTEHIIQRRSIANRFLSFTAFSGDVTISWVDDINGRMVSPTPYINILSEMMGVDIQYKHGHDVSRPPMKRTIDVAEWGHGQPLVLPNIPETNYDYSLCPLRLLFSYVLSNNPTNVSVFNQQFAIGGLIRALEQLQKSTGLRKDDIFPNISDIFPQLTGVELQNIYELAGSSWGEGETVFDDKGYTNLRLGIKYPPPVRKKIKTSTIIKKDVSLMTARPDRIKCMYCPHTDHCRYSIFGVDNDR